MARCLLGDAQARGPRWDQALCLGLCRYIEALKGGQARLQRHLLQADSLGIALLAATSAGQLCAELELDARGGMKLSGPTSILTAIEFKTSASGTDKIFLWQGLTWVYRSHFTVRPLQFNILPSRHMSWPRMTFCITECVCCAKILHQERCSLISTKCGCTTLVMTGCWAGLRKGRAQLKSRLQMLMWAATKSGAAGEGRPLQGRGYLYLPRSARVEPREISIDDNITIHVACI